MIGYELKDIAATDRALLRSRNTTSKLATGLKATPSASEGPMRSTTQKSFENPHRSALDPFGISCPVRTVPSHLESWTHRAAAPSCQAKGEEAQKAPDRRSSRQVPTGHDHHIDAYFAVFQRTATGRSDHRWRLYRDFISRSDGRFQALFQVNLAQARRHAARLALTQRHPVNLHYRHHKCAR